MSCNGNLEVVSDFIAQDRNLSLGPVPNGMRKCAFYIGLPQHRFFESLFQNDDVLKLKTMFPNSEFSKKAEDVLTEEVGILSLLANGPGAEFVFFTYDT